MDHGEVGRCYGMQPQSLLAFRKYLLVLLAFTVIGAFLGSPAIFAMRAANAVDRGEVFLSVNSPTEESRLDLGWEWHDIMVIDGVPYDRGRVGSSLRSIGYWLGAGRNSIDLYCTPAGKAPLYIKLQEKAGSNWHRLFKARVLPGKKQTIVHFFVNGDANWTAVYAGAQPIPHLTAAGYRAVILGLVGRLAKAIRAKRPADVEGCFYLSGNRLMQTPPKIRQFELRFAVPLIRKAIHHCRYLYVCPANDVRFAEFHRGLIAWAASSRRSKKGMSAPGRRRAETRQIMALYAHVPATRGQLPMGDAAAHAAYLSILWTGHRWVVGQGFYVNSPG